MSRRIIFLLIISSLLFSALSACAPKSAAGNGASASGHDMAGMKMAPLSDMPAAVQKASATTRESYQFAVANPDILKKIPCYCGCGDMGHTSNYACYVKSDADGKIVFDPHALGCSICVDITQDTMRMLKDGKSVDQIKAEIDKTYSKYGPSNIPQ